ncbi:MAG: DinB family protein [Bacteroidota bacterium]
MEHWLKQIDQNTADFQDRFGHLSPSALNWKPSPDIWSIAQNLDHLIVINESYFPVFEQLKTGSYQTPWYGKIRFIANGMGKMILGAVGPDRRKKTKTFPIWEPASSTISDDILDQFVAHQQRLKEEFQACAKLLEQGQVIFSPANASIVYPLETAFAIIVTHEHRHLAQAEEMLALLPDLTYQSN